MARRDAGQLERTPITAADMERFHRNAPAALARRGPAFISETFAESFETLLIGGVPIVGMLWFGWSADQLLLFLLIGTWTAILLDFVKYFLIAGGVEKFAAVKYDEYHVWVVAEALRAGRNDAPQQQLEARYEPALGVLIDLVCGGIGTGLIIAAMTVGTNNRLGESLQEPSVQLSLAGLILYQVFLAAWEIGRQLVSPSADGTPVYLGLRGLGLFLLMFLVVALRQELQETTVPARAAMLAVNGVIVAWAIFSVVGLVWLRGETRWLRNYLEERRRK